MKLLIALIFGGIIALSVTHCNYHQTSVEQAKTDHYTVYPSEQGGETVYSVVLPDNTAYDYLTSLELDTVLSGKELSK